METFEAKWAANLARTEGVLSTTGVPKETPITKMWTREKVGLGLWLELPEAAKDTIYAMAKELERRYHDVFEANPREAIHISIKNLSIVDRTEAAARMQEIMKKIGVSKPNGDSDELVRPISQRGLKLTVRGVNAFPVAVVAQVFDSNGDLQKLHQELVDRLGVLGFEGENFMAHVSLGRFKADAEPSRIMELINELKQMKEQEICSFEPTEAVLVRSEFYTPGSKYVIDGRF